MSFLTISAWKSATFLKFVYAPLERFSALKDPFGLFLLCEIFHYFQKVTADHNWKILSNRKLGAENLWENLIKSKMPRFCICLPLKAVMRSGLFLLHRKRLSFSKGILVSLVKSLRKVNNLENKNDFCDNSFAAVRTTMPFFEVLVIWKHKLLNFRMW